MGSENVRADTAYSTDLLWREQSRQADRIVPLRDGIKSAIHLAIQLDPRLAVHGTTIDGKRQPSFQESLEATDRRMGFLSTYLSGLPPSVHGVISGGSMSYGRFYNVREGYPDSSDLDLIVVTDGAPQLSDVDQMVPTDLGFEEQEQALFRQRVPVFEKGLQDGKMDVFSQKFKLPGQEFDTSAHFIPKTVLSKFMDTELKADLSRGADVDVRLYDYKPGSFPHRTNYQRDFEGTVYPLEVSETQTAHGTISMIPAYGIFNEQFVPGMYHNLCSPMFEVALDRGGVAELMGQFQTVAYAHRDAAVKKNPRAALSKSHIRHDVFSPHIIDEVDSK